MIEELNRFGTKKIVDDVSLLGIEYTGKEGWNTAAGGKAGVSTSHSETQ